MDPPSMPPSSTTTIAVTSSTTTKIRLLCSYGGHIAPRPQSNALTYAGGDTRIIALDRRTNAASLSALTAHLSRTIFNQRPFFLKYQLPNEDLDYLVSVTNDEDFQNMIEEHDRITGSAGSISQSRIRLFLFPITSESAGSMTLDRKSDSWFSDALNNTGIIRIAKSTNTVSFDRELSGLDTVGGMYSNATLQVQGDGVKNGGDVCGNGAKVVAGIPESFVLETSPSFGSNNSLVSMANSPAIAVQPEGDSVGLLEKNIRVPSSASIESDNGVGSNSDPSKKEIKHEQLIQVASEVLSLNGETENPNADLQSTNNIHKAVQFSGHHLPPQSEGKHLQYELPYAQGGLQYTNQYPTGQLPLASYYPMYPLPVQHQMQSPYLLNQPPYPFYLVPVRPNPNCNMSTEGCLSDNSNAEAIRPPLHPVGLAPSSLVKPHFEEHCEVSHPSRTATGAGVYVAASNHVSEFNNGLAYTQMYKTQVLAPTFTPQCQNSKETTVLPPESLTKQQTALQHQHQHQTSSYAQ